MFAFYQVFQREDFDDEVEDLYPCISVRPWMRDISQEELEEDSSMTQMQESLDKFSKSVSQRKVLIQRKNSLKEIQTSIIRSAQSSLQNAKGLAENVILE